MPFPLSRSSMSAGDCAAFTISFAVLTVTERITFSPVFLWIYMISSSASLPWSCTMLMIPCRAISTIPSGGESTNTPTVITALSSIPARRAACDTVTFLLLSANTKPIKSGLYLLTAAISSSRLMPQIFIFVFEPDISSPNLHL